MIKNFFRKNKIPFGVVFIGILIAAAVFLFLTFDKAESVVQSSVQWTEKTGKGIFVPACESATPSDPCPGGFTCTTAANDCGLTATGCTYDNFNSCSAVIPSNDLCPSAPAPVCTASCGGWSACSVSCGGGTQSRTCTRSDCSTYSESQSCNTQDCIPLPTASLSANPTSIYSGNSSTLSWTSQNATSCSLSNLSTGSSMAVSPTVTTNYTLQCIGPGGSIEKSATVTVGSLSWIAPVIKNVLSKINNFRILTAYADLCGGATCITGVWISASPTTIYRGQSTTLSWGSSDASFCQITTPPGPNYFNLSTSGNLNVSPNSTGRYYATCFRYTDDPWAYTTPDGVLITVLDPLPTVSLSANPVSIPLGQSSTLTWSSTNATSCSIDQGIGNVSTASDPQHPLLVSPTSSTTYTLTCTGLGGSTPASATVTVTAPLPTASFSASPLSISSGNSSTLTWTSENTTSCSLNNLSTNGSTAVSPTTDTTYTLQCTGPGGSASASATVTVAPLPLPGNFTLKVGSNGIDGLPACNSIPLTWAASSNATGYRILKGSSRINITPYNPYTALNFTDTTVSPSTDYRYQIEAYNATGINRSNALNVTTPACPPIVDLTTNKTSVYAGETAILKWSSSNADTCVASGAWSGSRATNNSTGEAVTPSAPQSTYTLTCTNSGGSTPDSVTINVALLPGWREIIPR